MSDHYAAVVQSSKWIELTQHLLDSFESLLGRPLIQRTGSREKQAWDLFTAPFVVLAHGTESDPIFCYANLAATQLWECDLSTLLRMPSRKTAESTARSSRQAMLNEGLKRGYIDDYHGVRISTTGRRFMIENAIIWNVLDSRTERRIGQAATFHDWRFLSE